MQTFATQEDLNIKNSKLIFDENTQNIEFLNLGQYTEKEARIDLKITEVEFRTSQNLRYLDLGKQTLGKITIKNCPKLESLFLFDCELEEIKFEGIFPELKTIDLSKNKLSALHLTKENFPKLMNLYVNGNSFNDLSFISSFITDENFDFGITENPLVKPPESVVKQGNDEIRNYFAKIAEQGTDYIYEAKFLILGDPRAGKTTLARKIKNINSELPPEDETTRGIDLERWEFKHNFTGKGEKDVIINIWDFGGQTIYKQTHTFFLTQRSLYVILSDGGASEKTDFKYWLHSTKTFGKDSPVIIFINEKEYRDFNIPFEAFRKINPNLKEKLDVNLKDANGSDNERFNKALDYIKSQLVSLKHLGEPVPKGWKKVREDILELEKKGEKVIFTKEFRQICKTHDIETSGDQISLARYLNDIGVFLHFHDNDILQKYVFINKQWILNGAYKVVDSKEVEKKNGKLIKSEFDALFSGEYAEYRLEIKEMLKVFNLIYEKDNFFAIPQHLPKDPPQYDWNTEENVSFNFDYEDYMPAGILWQFIVEMNTAIKDELVWRYGVVLTNNGAEAEIKEDYGKDIIKIRVRGTNKEDFRAVIINKIEEINKKYDNLAVKKQVPCICDDCKVSNEPYIFDYDDLKMLHADGVEKERCKLKSRNRSVEVSIDLLLRGVSFQKTEKNDVLEMLKEGGIHFHNNNTNNNTSNNTNVNGNNNNVLQDVNANNISASKNEIKEYLEVEFKKLHQRHNKHDENFEATKNEIIELFASQSSELQEFMANSFSMLSEDIKMKTTEILYEIEKIEISDREAYKMLDVIIETLEKQEDKDKVDKIAEDDTITVKQKISISIPFLIGKYSASVDLKNLEIPKTLSGLNKMLKKFKDKHFSLK